MKNKRVEVRVSLGWHQCVDALVRCFEANAETVEVFAKHDAAILRHIADMIDESLRADQNRDCSPQTTAPPHVAAGLYATRYGTTDVQNETRKEG